MNRYLHAFTISFILIGLLVGYAKADYNYDPLSLYNRFYYVWDKGLVILMALCIINPVRQINPAWYLLGGFFVIREIWEIFAISDYATASRPSIIFLLFSLDVFIICIIMFYPPIKKAIKWLKQV